MSNLTCDVKLRCGHWSRVSGSSTADVSQRMEEAQVSDCLQCQRTAGVVEVQFDIVGIRCLLCIVGFDSRDNKVLGDFADFHKDHRDRLEYHAIIASPPEMAGRPLSLMLKEASPVIA